jgi:CBS domain containing-hemolysin-like protein/mannitol/fructose-specific phosphotransferase system IIA component
LIIGLYLLAGLALLAVNFFFVMAEFAFVRVRPAQVEALAEAGGHPARSLAHVRAHMEEYLSVVQIGITGATLGMGIVIDEGLADGLRTLVGAQSNWARAAVAVIAFMLATYATIVASELVPKALALRHTERIALLCAPPMRLAHAAFFPLLVLLSRSAKAVLRLLGSEASAEDAPHSEQELRIILGESHEGGIMPLRRLLLFENVFDLGQLSVRDAMRPRERSAVIELELSRADVLERVRTQRYSRYPLVDPARGPHAPPVGIVHVKDLFYQLEGDFDLRRVARPFPSFVEEAPLESALATFQRTRNQLGVVLDAQGRWTGLLSFEDVIEEVIGAVEDEFEDEEPLHLEQLLARGCVALELPGANIEAALTALAQRLPKSALPPALAPAAVARALCERERALTSYVGKGIAIPHLRVDGLAAPVLAFGRSARPLAVPGRTEEARYVFLLLTPGGAARVHLRVLARIALLAESDAVLERLEQADSEAQLVEAIGEGDRITTG